MSNKLFTNPNQLKRANKLIASALAAVAFGSGIAGCAKPSLDVHKGDIVCSGQQDVEIKPGDTFDGENGIVAENIQTKETINYENPTELRKVVDGVTYQLGEIAASRAISGDPFIIRGTYDVVPIQLTAGKTMTLPEYCVAAQ